jgi:ABC-2 type transport system ATP-binding protein
MVIPGLFGTFLEARLAITVSMLAWTALGVALLLDPGRDFLILRPVGPASTAEVTIVTASISLRDVGRTFGATRALAGVSLDLEPGVTGLLGPNGAGKTTLLRLLATALPPTHGQLGVLGLDPQVPGERTRIRRQLGYLPQEIGLPRGFSAFAFVDYIALLKEWTQPATRHAEVRRVLGLVGLSGLSAKRIRAMSGGQRRRVALAQALLGSPPVLILDEPTTGVDPEQRVTLRAVLAEIARTSVVVLSTHQTEDVAALCERVIVLEGGRVRYDGPVTGLTAQAAGRVWLADEPDPAASVSWRTGTGRYRNVGARVRDDVDHVEPSLEDAYLVLRGGSAEDEPAAEVSS